MKENDNGLNMWDALPEECKSLILSRLTNKEAARIARVSKEFNEGVKNVRNAVQLLVLPPDLSPSALQGLVASHTNLRSLSFRRCSGKLKKFIPILAAAAGGSHQRSLESVDFRSCEFVGDADVNALCSLHSRLEDVNLANCHGISDAGLITLSRYRQNREAPNEQAVAGAVAPTDEDEELAIAENPEDQDYQNLENSSVCSWPELSPQPKPKALYSTRTKVENRNPSMSETRLWAALASPSARSLQGKSRIVEVLDESLPGGIHKDKWSERYRRYVLDEIENSNHDLPQLMDVLQMNAAHRTDNVRQASPSLSTDFHLDSPTASKAPVVVQSGSTGIDYYNFNVLSRGNKKLATRQKVYVHGSPANNLKDYNALMNDFKDSKAIQVGGATQVIDQRLEISDMPAEAFSTTQTDVGIFMISNNPERTPKLLSDSNLSPRISSEHRHGENAIRSLLGSTRLPTGFRASQIGAVMKNGKLRDTSPTSLEYNNPETPGSAQSTSTGDRCLQMEPPGLRLICVAGCSQITDKGVQALLRGASRSSLFSLDISRCIGVTTNGLQLPPISKLAILTATQLPNISRLVLQLSREGNLQQLNLAACPKLEDLHLVGPHLQSLNLSNCKKLTRIHLKCPALVSLNLSLCDNLETLGRFSCSTVKNLNVTGCRSFTQSAFSNILELTTGLQDLRCGGCERLERIHIPQASLLHLEVSGCSSLRRLNAYSRVLKVVEACGCKNLVEVFLYSPLLRRMLFTNCAHLQTLMIPLEQIKESVDSAVTNQAEKVGVLPEPVEISISGCNMPQSVRKNLSRLSKQWKSTFK
ncbi:hypothetical protein BDL97_08G091600 [Sphagnum fallax]|nr:hypothetical protein BDL97_08G091600 [Sphagnum fallax]